jgi:ubiquinone/menaquinone biosynthesis C-methylase UbiE
MRRNLQERPAMLWSATLGHREHIHPYVPQFFPDVARALPLTGREDLIDLGSGPGEVGFGFLPFVASLTCLDAEKPMLDAAEERARALGCRIRTVHAKLEEAPEDIGPFNQITMGRSHWFMHTPASHARMERMLAPGGHILICMPVQNPDRAAWHETYVRVRQRWVRGPHRDLMKTTVAEFFRGTGIVEVKRLVSHGRKPIDLDQVVHRALGTPSTTRAILGADADEMIAELHAALAPYFVNGPIMEKHATLGILFRRGEIPDRNRRSR